MTHANPQTDAVVPKAQYDALQCQLQTQSEQIAQLTEQLDWFKRQLFGVKSEKSAPIDTDQSVLFERPTPVNGEQPEQTVPAHTRRKRRSGDEVNDTGLRFDPSVPVRTIRLSCPELDGPQADEFEVIGYKTSQRLARQPGSHVVLQFERPIIRHKPSAQLTTTPAPIGVLDHAQVDVSLLAGLLIDKFVYHLPLYRQHQRLADEGITVARQTLLNWASQAIELVGPIAKAVQALILSGSHIKVDETPIKAGRAKTQAGRGKMKQGWLWPVLGEHGDIAFSYSSQRGSAVVKALLGEQFAGTIQTDGYSVYADYAARLPQCTHALCWAHTRRTFIKAQDSEPARIDHALQMIQAIYRIERDLRDKAANADAIIATRQRDTEPIVDQFFAWVNEQIQDPSLLPKSPLAKALNYARQREAGLRVFINDAWLAPDTNDLERALRVIPMGKKNWMFCTTEMGARHVAIIQTLLATCRAHSIDPYTYLVDVLQRINQHPANEIQDLTPRKWAQQFADNPIKSDLNGLMQ